MSVQKVSFSGIYDINFPQSCKSDEVDRAYKRVNDFVQEIPFLSKTVDILHYDKFINHSRQKGFRIISASDNPHLMIKLFSLVDEKLARQYVDKTKINLTV